MKHLLTVLGLIFIMSVRAQNGDPVGSVNHLEILVQHRATNFLDELYRENIKKPVSISEAFIMGDVASSDETLPNPLKIIMDRLYVRSAESLRENLDELLGKIIYQDDNAYSIGVLSVKKDTTEIIPFIPKKGKLISHRLTHESSTTLSLFLNRNATKKRIYEFTATDITRAVLKAEHIDIRRLQNLINSLDEPNQLKNYYIITAATTTEIVNRQYTKKTSKLKAGNFPISGSAIVFNGTFYVSDQNDLFEREYRVGLSYSRLDYVKKEVDALLKTQELINQKLP